MNMPALAFENPALEETVLHFHMAEWRREVSKCAAADVSALKRMVALCLGAREAGVDPDAARDTFRLAYAGAVAKALGVSLEAAMKAKTVQNRVSDCMAIFGAETLPGHVPESLQAAAKACRDANPKPGRQVNVAKKSDTDKAMQMLRAALAYATGLADSPEASGLIASMGELVEGLAKALEPEF